MSFDEVVSFLSDPVAYGDAGPVEVVTTHAAMIFLVGGDAYKVKRPVRYDYLDFTTLTARRAMLARELELNKPAAPEIYLGLVPVTRGGDGAPRLGGDGPAIEWCLHMRRFPKGAELAEVAARGALDIRLAGQIGQAVAALHARAEIREADGHALVAEIAQELDDAFAGMHEVFGAGQVDRFNACVADAIGQRAALLRARGRAGYVRRGHGDLHLGNMVLLNGQPVPFDALEFDERLGTLDVLYDLTFVLMDLLHREQPEAANAILGAYLYHADEPAHLDGLALLPLFLGLRAGIRAMVSVQAAQLSGDDAAGNGPARAYLDHALGYLTPAPPRLVAVGGLSGTGKTTLARQLAPAIGAAPGAVHLRSDLLRKALLGVDPLTRLPASAYSVAAGRRVYARMLADAERILKAGHSVVLDAVYGRSEERRAVAGLARRCGVAMTGLWLTADEEVLVGRVTARRDDASDADAGVVRGQLAAGAAAPDWVQVDAGGSMAATLARARAALASG